MRFKVERSELLKAVQYVEVRERRFLKEIEPTLPEIAGRGQLRVLVGKAFACGFVAGKNTRKD